ncbi:hypothetical protein MUK42_26462 [Musa troglodytarum]|uniref:Uncharacterized protein n=1 Tax=Musa troglodytarum TaxID=320322 RepID=A0A9E7FBF9_9LILI|nr:hypothetical protein MUK42_26462 [Musa troglodytarum]
MPRSSDGMASPLRLPSSVRTHFSSTKAYSYPLAIAASPSPPMALNSSSFAPSGGFMVAFAGGKYATRSSVIFVGNNSYALAYANTPIVWRVSDGRVGATSEFCPDNSDELCKRGDSSDTRAILSSIRAIVEQCSAFFLDTCYSIFIIDGHSKIIKIFSHQYIDYPRFEYFSNGNGTEQSHINHPSYGFVKISIAST